MKKFILSPFGLFLAAFVLRLAFALGGMMSDGPDRFQRPDSASYLAPASALAAGGEYLGADGVPTAHRTPGFPLLLAVLSYFGNRVFLTVFLILLGSAAVFPIHAACRLYAPPGASAFAALLFCLNPTAVAAAPMLLSDTFFMLFTAFSLYFFLRFIQKKTAFDLFTAVLFAGLGTLIRPINLLWILPAIFVLFCVPGITWKKTLLLAGGALTLFALCVVPWIVRNHAVGAGWRIDSSGASTLIHNASALESSLTGVPGEAVREKYEREFARAESADPDSFRTAAARLSLREERMTDVILRHPWRYLTLSLRPYSLLPDVPGLMENCGVSESGRGTFDVLNREGAIAAAQHYFAGRTGLFLAFAPLILAALALYLAAFAGLVSAAVKRDGLLLLAFLLFGVYYLILPGPVAMPRYQLPALPVFCVLAACAAGLLKKDQKNTRSDSLERVKKTA